MSTPSTRGAIGSMVKVRLMTDTGPVPSPEVDTIRTSHVTEPNV